MGSTETRKFILAQYTIRSKQNYIFRTNRLKENTGASVIIANIWEKLFRVAKDTCNMTVQRSDKDFHLEEVKKAFCAENSLERLNIVELFCGGGNETLLFDSRESFVRLNKAFSYYLMKKYPGIVPMAVCYETSCENYKTDYEHLMGVADCKKNVMSSQNDFFTVPFAMMDRETFMPYNVIKKVEGKPVEMSLERSGKEDEEIPPDEARILDDLGSLIAVVHADGNNMGAKISELLKKGGSPITEYDEAIEKMRYFTKMTADCFEKRGEEALNACRKTCSLPYRKIIGSGDDVTFICSARDVIKYTKAYLDAVQNFEGDFRYSSCAGICIFHSHYPYYKAYEIAEQACDNAKKRVRGSSPIEQGWVDFHIIRNGIGGDLEDIRKSQDTEGLISRPWLLSYSNDDHSAQNEVFIFDNLYRLDEAAKKTNLARSNIKEIGFAAERGKGILRKELERIYAHNSNNNVKLEEEWKKLFPKEDDLLKVLYDYSEVYDLWFNEEKQ